MVNWKGGPKWLTKNAFYEGPGESRTLRTSTQLTSNPVMSQNKSAKAAPVRKITSAPAGSVEDCSRWIGQSQIQVSSRRSPANQTVSD